MQLLFDFETIRLDIYDQQGLATSASWSADAEIPPVGLSGGGNLISGNSGNGVVVTGSSSTGNRVIGNFIGTDLSGTVDLGNAGLGIALVDAVNNTVQGNLVSGNDDSGVFLTGSAPTTNMSNLIEGNLVGTDVSGTRDLGNTLMGIRLFQGIGPTIRGNVVSGNDNTNIIVDTLGSGAVIEENRIGTDASGNAPLQDLQGPAGGGGVMLVGRDNVLRANVISANPFDGVNIDGLDVPDGRGSGNLLQENLIGVGIDGSTPLGNGRYGIRVWRGASNNTIGVTGTTPGGDTRGNVIAHNAAQGVWVTSDSSTGNSVRGNSLYANGGLGIDVAQAGITSNDIRDLDVGANERQNIPVVGLAEYGATTRVAGVLHSVPLSTFTLDFYANTEIDPLGHGEGARWLGSAVVATDASGSASYDVELPAATASGERITATATSAAGSTSEFSISRVTTARDGTLVVTNTNDSGLGSLREAILTANQTPGTDPLRIWFRVPISDTGYVDTDSHLPAATH